MKFRTPYDLGDFKDDEKGGGPLLVDASEYIPTDVLVAKLLRGEEVPGNPGIRYDLDDKVPVDKAFQSLDPTSRPGYDLADAILTIADADQAAKVIAAKKAELEQRQKQAAEKKAADDAKELEDLRAYKSKQEAMKQ